MLVAKAPAKIVVRKTAFRLIRELFVMLAQSNGSFLADEVRAVLVEPTEDARHGRQL